MTSSKFWLSSPFPFFIIRSNRQSNSIHSITFTLVSLQRYGKIEAILAPHKTGKVLTWAEENNVELVFTLTNASWLNPMECHFRSLKKLAILLGGIGRLRKINYVELITLMEGTLDISTMFCGHWSYHP